MPKYTSRITFNQLELLNSEGPILTLAIEGRDFILIDQKRCRFLITHHQLIEFIEGREIFRDSLNREIRWTTFEAEKPAVNRVLKFIEDSQIMREI